MSAAPLMQVTLEPDDLAALWRDLSVLARIESAQLEDHDGTRLCRIEQAFEALESGAARRIQIRYAFEDQAWFDTLTRGQDGIHLVRIAEDDITAAAADDAKSAN